MVSYTISSINLSVTKSLEKKIGSVAAGTSVSFKPTSTLTGKMVHLVPWCSWDCAQKFPHTYHFFCSFGCRCNASLLLFLHLFLDIIIEIYLSIHCFQHLVWLDLVQQRYSCVHHSHHYCQQVQKEKAESRPRITFSFLVFWSCFYFHRLFSSYL